MTVVTLVNETLVSLLLYQSVVLELGVKYHYSFGLSLRCDRVYMIQAYWEDTHPYR